MQKYDLETLFIYYCLTYIHSEIKIKFRAEALKWFETQPKSREYRVRVQYRCNIRANCYYTYSTRCTVVPATCLAVWGSLVNGSHGYSGRGWELSVTVTACSFQMRCVRWCVWDRINIITPDRSSVTCSQRLYNCCYWSQDTCVCVDVCVCVSCTS